METNAIYVKKLSDWMILRNYSKATISAYSCALRQFLSWRTDQNLREQATQEEARSYLLYRYEQGLRWQTINGDYSAMRKFFEHVLQKEWDVDHLPRPRKERSLPSILSEQEIVRLINCGRTLKHQVFMTLLYATGLRLSEALNLRIIDIDGERQQIRVVKGKGAKDRYVAFPDCILVILRQYYRSCRPEKYFFNGKYRSTQWAQRSAQYALEQARKDAGIGRTVSPHILRHCYATHHLENGTNLVYLKEQLGHKHLKTTARYVHLCQSYQHRVNHPVVKLEIIYRIKAG